MTQRYDIIVVGGGLAGSAAASLLARAGATVLLLEAATLPHDKLCGEFLSPETVGIFQRLGVWSAIDALAPPRLTAARIIARDGARWDAPFPAPGIGLSRYALDKLLFDHAGQVGADVRQAARVTGMVGSLVEGFGVTWQTGNRAHAAEARVVLGAWGRRANLDRTLGRGFLSLDHPTFALKAHYHGPPIGRRVELHGFDGGYCGLAEIEGGRINLCLLAETRVLHACGGDPERLAAEVLPTNTALAAWLAHAERIHDRFLAISQIPFVRKAVVENDVLMLGDAAGLISPLAGNGMAMGLAAAEMAAPLVLDTLAGRRTAASLKATYSRQWHARFDRRLRLGRLAQPLMLRPITLGLGLRALRLIPPLGAALVANTRDSYVTSET